MKKLIPLVLFVLLFGCESAVDIEKKSRTKAFLECVERNEKGIKPVTGAYSDMVYECREVSYKAVPYVWRGE